MKIKNHSTRIYSGIVLERLKHLPAGGKMCDLPKELQHNSYVRTGEKKTGGPNMRLIRLTKEQPALTVTAYIFNKFVHPIEDRYITPREAAILQDFPIDYEFKGNLGQVHKQIGNAVPVKLATALARQVSKFFESIGRKGTINIASFFTGAGGLDLGFETASNDSVRFRTAFSSDIEHWSEETINANRPEWNFHRADITKLDPIEVQLTIGKKPDIIIGGPPCQPFSVAGKQKATGDPLGALYRDYLRHVEALQPEIVIMENVYGLAQVKSANMLSEIYNSFSKIGYEVTHRELLAADFGTPQKRRRLIFVASKNLQHFNYPLPTHAPAGSMFGLQNYEGAGNAILNLPPATIR